VAIAGNWFYIPLEITAEDYASAYAPIPFYPDDDPADAVYHSNLTYIPSQDIYYIEWNYIWLNISQHTPDTERVRVYIKNNSLHHVSLSIHYQWMDVYSFEKTGNHVHIYFTPVYHTPYTTPESYIIIGLTRLLPISIFLLIGIILILYEILHKQR